MSCICAICGDVIDDDECDEVDGEIVCDDCKASIIHTDGIFPDLEDF
jgi:hypothetical protein